MKKELKTVSVDELDSLQEVQDPSIELDEFEENKVSKKDERPLGMNLSDSRFKWIDGQLTKENVHAFISQKYKFDSLIINKAPLLTSMVIVSFRIIKMTLDNMATGNQVFELFKQNLSFIFSVSLFWPLFILALYAYFPWRVYGKSCFVISFDGIKAPDKLGPNHLIRTKLIKWSQIYSIEETYIAGKNVLLLKSSDGNTEGILKLNMVRKRLFKRILDAYSPEGHPIRILINK